MSHRFALRSDDAELARRAAKLIADFTRPVHDPTTDRDRSGRAPESIVYSLRAAQSADGSLRYMLERGDQQVAASQDPAVVLSQLMWQISTDTVELALGYLMVHSGAVVSPGGDGVLILGESGSGKTTLVAALVQEGFGYLSDEAAVIELDTGLAHPWPRPLGFRNESRSLPRFAPLFAPGSDHAGVGAADETHVAIERIRTGAIAEPTRVRHVIDYSYEPAAPTRFERLSRAIGLVKMGSAAPRLRHEGGPGLAVLAGVMRGADAHSLVGGDLEHTVQVVRERVDR